MSMSARAIATGPEDHSAETLLREDAAQTRTPGRTMTEGFTYDEDRSSEARDELLRRYEVPLPLLLPWRHGGLNE
jgi:hypothetical protein